MKSETIKFGVGYSFRGVDPDCGCCPVELWAGTVRFLGRGAVGEYSNGWQYEVTTENPEEARAEIVRAGGVLE